MKKIDFCFTIVCSENYILETIGLIKNINHIYPKRKIFIISLDLKTEKTFKKYKLKCQIISVSEIWGRKFYKNIKSRMSIPEIAYASKSASAFFILKKFSKSILILDADLLILKKIDDIINFTKKYPVTMVSANHNLDEWKRTNKIGLFSAGIIGFSSESLDGIKWWKKQCFDNTNVNIFLGYYNEQKYLDYLLTNYETKIIRDYGINLSSTFLKRARPYLNKNKGDWLTAEGKLIRIFHQSRVTDHPIYKKKLDYISEDQKKEFSFQNVKKNKKTFIIFRVDVFFAFLLNFIGQLLNVLICLKRILTQRKINFFQAMYQSFIIKQKMLTEFEKKKNDK